MLLFVNILNKTHSLELDSALTIDELKNMIEINEFIPSDMQILSHGTKNLYLGTLNDNDITPGSTLNLNCRVLGGTRYKKSSSQMRWKWRKKRIRRLQRKRRKMRNRAK
tara:strand:- start:14008 stop:14334 length:327 start_codon:yes stop_codon:yes gene_type:complete